MTDDLAAEGDRPHVRYTVRLELEPRVCTDCGAIVNADHRAIHDRWHSILASHGWALAVLQTAHIAAHVHDRYEAYDKINSRKFDNWSADALREVMGDDAR